MRPAAATIVARQRDYACRHALDEDCGLIVPATFVRSVRHMGYRTNVEALAEFVDNSVQAYAETVDVVFGYDAEATPRKPTYLAVIDDGHGMGPEMLRLAMMWGGTHRENDRAGLGRFGYGLPCAAVSIGQRFTIYSKPRGGRLHAVTLDLGNVGAGGAGTGMEITIPRAQPARLPSFVHQYIRRSHPDGLRSGTVIVIENLDRLDWSTAGGLRRNLIRRFGVAYHKLLSATRMQIDGELVRPIDPLFLDPGADLHGIDEDRAAALDPVTIRVDGNGGEVGEVTLQYAWLPPSFASIDKSRDATGINANDRFSVMKQYHGIIFGRNGRLIDVQSRTPWTTFINNDRYIRVKIDFSAALDEWFGVTTSKQQVSVSPAMWDHLRAAGLHKAIEHLRAKVRCAKAERGDRDNPALAANARRSTPIPALASMPNRADPTNALRVLLNEIERRASRAESSLRAEYRDLLATWTRRITGSQAEPSP